MSGELLTLIAITCGAPLATVLFLHITGANAYREMERRQARFRELSDLVELPAAAKMHGEGAHKRRSDRLAQGMSLTHSGDAQ